jgi:hypothetical protein
MELANFEKSLQPILQKKGFDYFIKGKIDELENNGQHWFAFLREKETDYDVQTFLNNGILSNYQCDCAAETEVCEHLIALFYAVKEKNEAADGTTKTVKAKTTKVAKEPKVPKKSNKPETFVQLVERIPADQLRAFLKESFSRNQQFKSLFMVYFASETSNDGPEKYITVVENAIKVGMGRRQYAPNKDVKKMLKPLGMILKQGNAFVADKNFGEAKILAEALITKLHVIYGSIDDYGDVGEIVREAYRILGGIMKSEIAPLELKKETRKWLTKFIADPFLFRNGDLSDYGVKTLIDSLQSKNEAEPLINAINNRFEAIKSNKRISKSEINFYQKYYGEKVLFYIFRVYEKLGMIEKMKELEEANSHLTYIKNVTNQFSF